MWAIPMGFDDKFQRINIKSKVQIHVEAIHKGALLVGAELIQNKTQKLPGYCTQPFAEHILR